METAIANKQQRAGSAWRLATTCCAGFIAFVFFHGVYLMAADWGRHVQRMGMQVFGLRGTEILSWALPALYLCIAAAVSYQPSRRGGLCAAVTYLSLLCVYLTLGKLRYLEICACVGFIDSGSFWVNMRFNGLLLVLTVGTTFLDRPGWPSISWFVRNRRKGRRKEGTAM